jgi:3,4-dihydroxy 2-butanone 4-phosphate synthase/GTP cyclohydrolase II
MNRNVHLALVRGDLRDDPAPLVRVHVPETLNDLIGVIGARQGWSLRDALRRIAEAGSGVVVVLRYEEGARHLLNSVRGLGAAAPAEPARREGGTSVLRTFGAGAQILRDLGVRRMRVLSAPKQMHAISGFGLEVVEYVDGPA